MLIPHAAFLGLTAIVALVPLRLAVGRGKFFAPLWLAWILIWGSLALLTVSGIFTFSPPLLRLLAHIGGQVVVGIMLFQLVPAIRAALRSIPLGWLVGWQQARVIGGFFLIGAAMGEVPWTFALIAGLGDLSVGLAAMVTSRLIQPDNARRLAGRHMVMGMTDFAVAISTAIVMQVNLGWPYLLIPLFLVPMALLAHLAVLDRILPHRATA